MDWLFGKVGKIEPELGKSLKKKLKLIFYLWFHNFYWEQKINEI